jgi:protein gp37
MAKETKIQWTDSTVNPIQGCAGCELYETPTVVIGKIDDSLKALGIGFKGSVETLFETERKRHYEAMLQMQRDLTTKASTEVVSYLTQIFLKKVKKSIQGKENKKNLESKTKEWNFDTDTELFEQTTALWKTRGIVAISDDYECMLEESHQVAITNVVTAVKKIKNRLTTSAIKTVLPDVLPQIKKQYGKEARDAVEGVVLNNTACYASELTRRYGLSVSNPTKGINTGMAPEFEQLKEAPGEMVKHAKSKDLIGTVHPSQEWKSGLPRMIFISDMGDSLAAKKDFPFLAAEVLPNVTSDNGSRHIWQWLSKRPLLMRQFAESHSDGMLPKNLMAMTTLTCWDEFNQDRLEALKSVGASMRGLSVEPQRDRIPGDELDLEGIDWMIIGGESGGHKYVHPFHLEWALELIECCKKQGVAPFVKQWGYMPFWEGKPIKLKDEHGGKWDEWLTCEQIPEDVRATLHVREFPKAYYEYRKIPKRLSSNRPTPVKMKKPKKVVLTEEEQTRFDELDKTVKQGTKGVLNAAVALAEIQEGKLYRAKFGSFGEYCESIHDFSRQYAYALMKAGKTYVEMSTYVDKFGDLELPKREGYLRELGRVKDAEKRCEILAEVIEEKGPEYTTADLADKVKATLGNAEETGEPRPPSPGKRLEAARETLAELEGALNLYKGMPEVRALLKSLRKNLG